jgi:hypothetical protein
VGAGQLPQSPSYRRALLLFFHDIYCLLTFRHVLIAFACFLGRVFSQPVSSSPSALAVYIHKACASIIDEAGPFSIADRPGPRSRVWFQEPLRCYFRFAPRLRGLRRFTFLRLSRLRMLRFKKAWKGYRKPSLKLVPPENPTDRITHIGAECDRDSKGECRPGKISTYGADETDFRPWYPDINRVGGSRIASQGKRTGDQQLLAPDASTLQDGGDPHDPAQSGRSRGKSWRSGYTMVRIDHYQSKREAGLTALLGLPQLQSIS